MFTTKSIASDKSFHDFQIESISGETINLSDYKSNVVLLVNTASKCGFTPQYKGLEELAKTYKEQLVVIGFPCDQFGGQEPGSNVEIEKFCKLRN